MIVCQTMVMSNKNNGDVTPRPSVHTGNAQTGNAQTGNDVMG